MILSDLSGEIVIGGESQLAALSQKNARGLCIFNPASETEPLYVSFGKPSSPASIGIEPGEHKAWQGQAPDNEVYLYAATSGHKYTMWAGKGRTGVMGGGLSGLLLAFDDGTYITFDDGTYIAF